MFEIDGIEIRSGSGSKVHKGVIFVPSERNGLEHSISIGDNVIIRAGSIVYAGACIGDNVTIDHYCIIREGADIGEGCRIRNYTEIGRDVIVGRGCILSGFIANRVKIGENTSSFGHLVHRYPDHGEGYEEASPIIGDNVIIGTQAIIAGEVVISHGERIKAGQLVTYSSKVPKA